MWLMELTSLGWSPGLRGVSGKLRLRLSPYHWLGRNWDVTDKMGFPPSRILYVGGKFPLDRDFSTKGGFPPSRDLSRGWI
jgi:hypothetical protein